MGRGGRISIRVKKEVRLNRLDPDQAMMLKVGTVDVASVVARAKRAHNLSDGPAKPLTKWYAIRKTKAGKGNRRNLTLTGSMLGTANAPLTSGMVAPGPRPVTGGGLSVRSVSQNRVYAGFSTLKERQKAMANENIEPWLGHSRKNEAEVMAAFNLIMRERLNTAAFITRVK